MGRFRYWRTQTLNQSGQWTVTEMDRFLASLGYIQGPPNIQLDTNK